MVAMLSDHGYILIQVFFQALQLYSWGVDLVKTNFRTVAMASAEQADLKTLSDSVWILYGHTYTTWWQTVEEVDWSCVPCKLMDIV